MKIYQDINLSEFKFWSGAKAWAAEFTSEELDEIGEILENDGYAPEGGWTDTAVNDLFWFEPEFVASLIGKIIPDLAQERFDAGISAVEDEIRNSMTAMIMVLPLKNLLIICLMILQMMKKIRML